MDKEQIAREILNIDIPNPMQQEKVSRHMATFCARYIADYVIFQIAKAKREVAEEMLNSCCNGQDFADRCKELIQSNSGGE